jgi:hypothetical protein
MADQIQNPEEIMANFEELSILESEFEDVEIELSKASLWSLSPSQLLTTTTSPQDQRPPCTSIQETRHARRKDSPLLGACLRAVTART